MAKFKAGDRIVMREGTSQYERVVVGYSQKGYVVYEYKDVIDGQWTLTSGHEDQYKLAPVKKEGWVNIYRSNFNPGKHCGDAVFTSKEEATAVGTKESDYVATVKIEWEE